MKQLDFPLAFEALTDHAPLRWQTRLYDRLRASNTPSNCNLPTGLGKTSVIPIWLIALASQVSATRDPNLPRRLIYIVNRRTVVDQATEIAERLRKRIFRHEAIAPSFTEIIEQLRNALCQATALSADQPIAISTLRGELADNEEWKADPARPAIIVGTIDMIGSKLLFSGYGDGYRMRPHHAGLIGQDALIIHDEAHLTPAFGALLRSIAEEQKKCGELRRVHVMELSATPSTADDNSAINLESEDEKDALVPQRLDAEKWVFLHEAEAGQLANQTIENALKYQSKAVKVLIYVRSPQMAQEIVSNLEKVLGAGAEQRVALLTGTIRGHERDQLVRDNPVYRALLHRKPVEQAVYLVSTSAGEVGIDLDADHMISDLTTLDSMIQRFGRVNRSGGEGRSAVIDVIIEKKKEDEGAEKEKALESAKANTRRALEKLPRHEDGAYAASPRALRNLLRELNDDERDQAFAPKPSIAPVTDILLDAWSLTSVREKLPGRPEVAAYLHGMTEFDPPETYVAWRSEVKFLAGAGVPAQMLRSWFKCCRIEARERLRDLTNRVTKELQRIAKRQGESPLHCVVLNERGEAESVSLPELMKGEESGLQFRTVVLPVEAGGLTSKGILDGGTKDLTPDLDVAEGDGKRARVIVESIGNLYGHRRLMGDHDVETEIDPLNEGQEYSSVGQAAARIAQSYGKVVSEIIPLKQPAEGDEDEGKAHYLLLLVEPKKAATETPESAGYKHRPKLNEHLEEAAWIADKITSALGLEGSLKDAVVTAARWHDRGKDRRRWQHAIFNDNPNLTFAKSGPRGMDWRRLGGYRHEFGSLLDAAKADEVLGLPEADLILHLIAAHHGRARPHFDPDGWDMERYTTSDNAEAAHEVMRRFGRLQQRFGRWGLAWLESLVRCADVVASRQAVQQHSPNTPEEG